MSASDPEIYVSNLKLVLLGESSVGKSSIVMRYTTGNFRRSNATIGAAYTTRTTNYHESETVIKRINLEIWDTAGQERYRSLAPMYYRNTDVAFIVFDVTKPESLRKAQSWINELKSYVEQDRRDDIHIVLVGNKIDLDHTPIVMDKEFVQVSAKSGAGINELFEGLVKDISPDKFKKLTPETTDSNKRGKVKLGQNESQKINGCNCL